jgi:hypothetical protein
MVSSSLRNKTVTTVAVLMALLSWTATAQSHADNATSTDAGEWTDDSSNAPFSETLYIVWGVVGGVIVMGCVGWGVWYRYYHTSRTAYNVVTNESTEATASL